jgi:DNA-binding MarR family transcriptional regulator
MSRASVSAILKTLVRDGWVERSPSPHDGRSTTLALTAAGAARIPDLFLRLNRREQAWAHTLDATERTQLVGLLRRVLDGAPDDAPRRR